MKKLDARDGYGASLPVLLWHDVRDRLSGNKARANARWGWVTPPAGRGKVIVVHGGREFHSLQLAADLLAAVRHKRQDVRLVLLFENDFRDAYSERLRGLKKVAVGYSSCDRSKAVHRILQRLSPLGIILVGQHIRPGWSNVLRDKPHVVAFHCESEQSTRAEACYPALDASNSNIQCDYLAPPFDAQTILVQAQVEPSFSGIVRGSGEFPIWLLHGQFGDQSKTWIESWREQPLSERSLLCITAYDNPQSVTTICEQAGLSTVRVSQWQRKALAPGTVLIIDQPHWLPALSASINAGHMINSSKVDAWQLMAGGKALSRDAFTSMLDDAPVPVVDTPNEVFHQWQNYLDEPFKARQSGDANRKYFWQQRRKAQSVVDELLQRVYDW